ncbi:enoyl-CoA hydratase/isomerase family protein, partial [Achromobacter insolitus]
MTAPSSYVLVDDEGGVRTLTLNRAAKANALNADMLSVLRRAIDSAPQDGIGLIVLRSASPSLFC